MMITDNKSPRWLFYPAWVASSTISIFLAGVIAWALVSQVGKAVGGTIQVGGRNRIAEDFFSSYVLLLVLGLLAGFLQYLLLRRHLSRMGWWMAATTLGLLLGRVGGRLFFHTLYGALDAAPFGTLMTVLLGGSVGLAQWLVLRRRVRRAAWWVLANGLGWGTVGWGAATLSHRMVLPAVGLLLAPGIATGVALWLLLDRLPRREGKGRDSPSSHVLELTA